MSLNTTLSILFSLLTLCAFIFYRSISKRRRLCYFASKLDGPPALPLIGSAFYLIGTRQTIFNNILRLLKMYKSPWKIWLGRQLYVVISEPRDIEIVMNQAIAKAANYKFAHPVLGEGLFTGPVDKWKRHRKVILTTFKIPILNSYVEVFAKHAESLVERLRSQVGETCFNIFPIITQSALGMTCESAMGCDSKDQSENLEYALQLSKAMSIIFGRLFKFYLHPNIIWRFTPQYKMLTDLSRSLKSYVEKIVAEKKRSFMETGTKKSFVDHLISLSEQSEHWSDEELMEEAQTMVAAGSESIGSSTSYTLIMLGMHPAVQEKVFEEVNAIFGNSKRSVNYEDLSHMVYLEQVIKETLRLFPLAAALGRMVEKDIVTDDYTLPAGCECIIAILYTHRNPEIWEEPLEFKPERFTPEEISKRHPYAYLPFSGGPRNCIGSKYAMMAMKTITSTILRNYRVSTDFQNVGDIDFEAGVVLKSEKGYRVSLEFRE